MTHYSRIDQARAGANVGTVTDVARLSSFVPSLAIMSAPFLFDTFEQADKFAASEEYLAWGEELKEKAGIVMLASNWYQGARHALTQKPISNPADLAGVRMRTIGAPVWIETIRAMGAEPTPIAWGEVYSALQTGTIDAAEAQPTAIKGAKLYEVIKHVTKTGHIQLVTALVVAAEAWDQISPEHQKIVRELAVENGRYASQMTIELGEQALTDVAASGVTISEVDLAPFKDHQKNHRNHQSGGVDCFSRLSSSVCLEKHDSDASPARWCIADAGFLFSRQHCGRLCADDTNTYREARDVYTQQHTQRGRYLMLLLVAGLFVLFLISGMPVAFALALASIPVFVLTGTMPPTVAIQKMVTATQSFPLLAVPFFIFAGNLMNATGITARLVKFARLLTGWLAGGLGQVSIMLSLMMGGISGSAVADASMEARLLGPSMISQGGHSKATAAAVLAAGSIITATIPPSIGLILFGFINEVSIGRLFLAGVVPGVLLTATLMLTAWLVAKRNGYEPDLSGPPSFRQLMVSFRESFWALAFPVILIVGFRFGFFTATEAGAFLVFYALFIGFFVYRELTLAKLYDAIKSTAQDLGMVMLLIMMAAVLGFAVTIEQGPQQIAALVTTLTQEPVFILILVLLLLLISGMFLEGAANILLVTPIVLPVLIEAGFDPVHMGILMITLINIGGIDAKNHPAKIIAKIEKPEALTEINKIIKVSNGIMIARGDLGVEVPIEKLPSIQKRIILKCIQRARPVIVATQMMNSMITNPSPTRAEVTDVANAVLDGADAVMLSGETSVGKYPLEVVRAMNRIIDEAEMHYSIIAKRPKPSSKSRTFYSDVVCFNAAKTAEDIGAVAIIGMTSSGYTAFKLSSYRPQPKIFIFSDKTHMLSTLNLVWGVKCFYYDKFTTTDETIRDVAQILKKTGHVQIGDVLVNTGSMPLHKRYRTNMLKVTIID